MLWYSSQQRNEVVQTKAIGRASYFIHASEISIDSSDYATQIIATLKQEDYFLKDNVREYRSLVSPLSSYKLYNQLACYATNRSSKIKLAG